VEDETHVLIQNGGNDGYSENYGNFMKKSAFPSIRSDLENMKKNKKSGGYNNYENYYKEDDKNNKFNGNRGDAKYVSSPYRSYGANDVLIKSSKLLLSLLLIIF
jgi:predicted ribonuclease toxin of YeeF-YezG toxin-antitoxin module